MDNKRKRIRAAIGKPALAAVIVLATGMVGGFISASPSADMHPAPVLAKSASASKSAKPSYGGEVRRGNVSSTGLFSIDFESRRSISSASGEQLELAVLFQNRFPDSADVAYVVDITDDLGNKVEPSKLSPVVKVGARETMSVDARTPAHLSDGFYQLRVRAVARSRVGMSVGTDNAFFFKVESGSIVPIDIEEWHEFSRANMGV